MHGLTGRKQTPEHIAKRMKNQASWPRTRYWLGKKHTQEEKDRISKTKRESPTTVRGEKHHNWKGGVEKEHNKARQSAAYKTWRDSVYRKDNWSCQECGIHCQKGNIVAHHLISFADNVALRYMVDNGIVLCRPCHARVHKEDLQIGREVRRGMLLAITHT